MLKISIKFNLIQFYEADIVGISYAHCMLYVQKLICRMKFNFKVICNQIKTETLFQRVIYFTSFKYKRNNYYEVFEGLLKTYFSYNKM